MQRYAGRTLTAVWHSAAGHETRLKARGSRLKARGKGEGGGAMRCCQAEQALVGRERHTMAPAPIATPRRLERNEV